MDGGGEEDLHIGLRQDSRPDVTAVKNDAALFGLAALDGDHRRAHAADGGNFRYMPRDFRRADEGRHIFAIHDDVHGIHAGLHFHIEGFCHSGDLRRICQTLLQGFIGDGAIHRSGIEIGIAKA